MIDTFAPDELERLRDGVGDLFGFAFDQDRLQHLGAAVRGRMTALRLLNSTDYLARLQPAETRKAELRALAELLTVTETFFFRSHDQVQALLDVVVAERAARGQKELRVISAGCASGEEPYTLAIALSEALPDLAAWNIQIVALDVNPAMLAKAEAAKYSLWSLRATPEFIRAKYFRSVGNEYQLAPEVRRMVEFRELNLTEREASDPGHRGSPWGTFVADAVFCRNVLMYFTPETMSRVVTRLTRVLAPGGLLFLGHAETLRGLSHDYRLCHTHGTFYYQKQQDDLQKQHRAVPLSPREAGLEPKAPAITHGESPLSWFETIQAASLRVTALSERAPKPELLANPAAAPARGRSRLPEVLELIGRERFIEALAMLEALPGPESGSPDALLLLAVLLTNRGRISEAEKACQRLLELDGLNAGAHYLKALCCEHAGDEAAAREHDSIAIHLDPSFAMPHLHAGLLAKRAGEAAAARRELAQAFVLLEREEVSRIALFGGGFSRDALIGLCKGELLLLKGGAR